LIVGFVQLAFPAIFKPPIQKILADRFGFLAESGWTRIDRDTDEFGVTGGLVEAGQQITGDAVVIGDAFGRVIVIDPFALAAMNPIWRPFDVQPVQIRRSRQGTASRPRQRSVGDPVALDDGSVPRSAMHDGRMLFPADQRLTLRRDAGRDQSQQLMARELKGIDGKKIRPGDAICRAT
jgi:hypothetical protein